MTPNPAGAVDAHLPEPVMATMETCEFDDLTTSALRRTTGGVLSAFVAPWPAATEFSALAAT